MLVQVFRATKNNHASHIELIRNRNLLDNLGKHRHIILSRSHMFLLSFRRGKGSMDPLFVKISDFYGGLCIFFRKSVFSIYKKPFPI